MSDKLHATLREFYSKSAGYFDEAGEANTELTPERKALFEFIPHRALMLDVGCGRCENASFLGERVRYVGFDLSPLGLEKARALERPLFGAALGESQSMPFQDGAFDVCLSTYALEHFVFPERCLREMWRVCKKGGRVILISPAYDNPLLLPPSIGHWGALRRWKLIFTQAMRQAARHLNSRAFFFAQIAEPRVLGGEYQPDFDAVHLVSAREIANFFRALGGRILFERKRSPRAGSGPRDWIRNSLLRAGLGEYAGMNLQIVIEKP
jgi:SAM-dependent methyltransferase